MNEHEQRMVEAINAVRGGRGLPALVWAVELGAAARRHAADMAAHPGLVHDGSDGSTIDSRMREAGYRPSVYREVVGWGFRGDVGAMLDWWLASPGHVGIVLNGDTREIGVGYVYEPAANWGHYWCVDFGRRAAVPEPPPTPTPPPYSSHIPVVVGAPTPGPATPANEAIDLLRFKLADPDCWRVVRHPHGAQEDVQDMELGGGLFVRRKGGNGEWHRYDDRYFYLVHDTSPAPGAEGIERVYTLYKDGMPGAPKSRRFQALGEAWQEDGLHRVQFRARHGCRPLAENSGMAQNRSIIVRHERNFTFNRYGQQLTFDEVIWERTGVEMQIYGRQDGRSCGWIGWDAPWGSSEPVEIHWGRGRLRVEPERCCGF
jgi:hypothetical protein